MTDKVGNGLYGEYVARQAVPAAQAPDRRRSDREAGERLAVLEHQVSDFEQKQGEFRTEMQVALHALAEQLSAGLIRVHERVDAIPGMITSAVAEHERQEEGLYGPRLMAIEVGMKEMKDAADDRHRLLGELSVGVANLNETVSGVKDAAVSLIKWVVIAGGSFTVAAISFLVSNADKISNLLKVGGW
jgi:hypothetical protein